MKPSIVLGFLLLLLAGCSSAPYTGRSQLLLGSEGQEAGLGEEAYRHILRDSVPSQHRESVDHLGIINNPELPPMAPASQS